MNFGNNDLTRWNISNSYSVSQPWMDPIACFWRFPTIGEREGKYLTRCILGSLALLRVVHFVAGWIAFSPPPPAPPPRQALSLSPCSTPGPRGVQRTLVGKSKCREYNSLISGSGTGSPGGWAAVVSLFRVTCWQPLGCVKGEATGIDRSLVYELHWFLSK